MMSAGSVSNGRPGSVMARLTEIKALSLRPHSASLFFGTDSLRLYSYPGEGRRGGLGKPTPEKQDLKNNNSEAPLYICSTVCMLFTSITFSVCGYIIVSVT